MEASVREREEEAMSARVHAEKMTVMADLRLDEYQAVERAITELEAKLALAVHVVDKVAAQCPPSQLSRPGKRRRRWRWTALRRCDLLCPPPASIGWTSWSCP